VISRRPKDPPTASGISTSSSSRSGYPGHHVYNVLLEDKLVKGRGWVEYTVYPLYSPQSLLAEGTANVGIDILFSDDERRRALTEVLGPAAGVSKEAILALGQRQTLPGAILHVALAIFLYAMLGAGWLAIHYGQRGSRLENAQGTAPLTDGLADKPPVEDRRVLRQS
jgi:hypothetical protein